MSYGSEALAFFKSKGLLTSFTWYSNVADALMTKEIEGSFQAAVTNANTWGKIAYTDNTGQKLFFTTDIKDITGFELTTGDFLYESKSKTVYLYNKTYIGEYICDDISAFSVVNGSTTYTYNVDYKVDFQRGVLTRIVPKDGNGSIYDYVDTNWDFADGAVFSNTEVDATTSKIQLTKNLLGDYESSGYWLSYPFIKNTNLVWDHTNLITFEIDDLTDVSGGKLVVSLFPGNTSNANMIAGTGAIACTATTSTVGSDYLCTISVSSLSLISSYDALRIKIALSTTDVTHTPTVYTTGIYSLKMKLIGAKCVVTYTQNKYVVRKILNDPKVGYVEVTLQREDR